MDSFFMALQFLTRLHFKRLDYSEEIFGKSTAFFPLVGFILGGILAGVNYVARLIFPQTVAAAVIVAATVLLTGGLHLDGFMDSVDALFSGRDRQRKLEIMKDSRVGSFGVIGLFLLLLLKYTLLAGWPDKALWRAILIVPTASRWAMLYTINFFPYIRKEGLGKPHTKYSGSKEFYFATTLAILILGGIFRWPGVVLLAVTLVLTHWVVTKIVKELGGVTGDIYGAVNEIMEVFGYFVLFVLMTAVGRYRLPF